MAWSNRTLKAQRKRREWPVQQFGQANDYYTFGGSTGCTHTVLQVLAYIWLGKKYSHDTISKLVGYPLPGNNPGRRGLRPSEVQTFCRKVGLPYAVKYGMSAYDVLKASVKGPVAFGHSYSRWPEWYGYTYAGRTADSIPNGFARPLRQAGRTQLSGFVPPYDAHFGLLLGWQEALSTRSFRVCAWEPNHGSPSRREQPAYDLMTSAQFRRVYESYQKTLGRSPYALIPTRWMPA